jgi:hypothetical protein
MLGMAGLCYQKEGIMMQGNWNIIYKIHILPALKCDGKRKLLH